MKQNSAEKITELAIIEGFRGKYPLTVPKKKMLKARDILRIHSQLISGFMRGDIPDDAARSLAYLCTSYITALQAAEFEKRLEALERGKGTNVKQL